MEKANTLKALVLGGTGAVGRELVQELVRSSNWSEVTVIVRRKLEEWDKFSDVEKNKLQIIQQENLDDLQDVSKWNFNGVSTLFCCLGTQLKHGKENFIKVDRTYPNYAGKLALHCKIPHFSLCSSGMADRSSWFFFKKTKGQTEDDLKAMNLPHLSIIRPGILLERRNDERFAEKLGSYIPFWPKIQCRDVAKAMRIEAELQNETPHSQKILLYLCGQVQQIADTGKYPEKL